MFKNVFEKKIFILNLKNLLWGSGSDFNIFAVESELNYFGPAIRTKTVCMYYLVTCNNLILIHLFYLLYDVIVLTVNPFSFQTFYFVLKKLKYTTYIKCSITICGLAVGPLVETGHARIIIRAMAVSQAEFTNCSVRGEMSCPQ